MHLNLPQFKLEFWVPAHILLQIISVPEEVTELPPCMCPQAAADLFCTPSLAIPVTSITIRAYLWSYELSVSTTTVPPHLQEVWSLWEHLHTKTVAFVIKVIAGNGKDIDQGIYFDQAKYFDQAEYFCHHFYQRNCHTSIYTVLIWPTVISATFEGQQVLFSEHFGCFKICK